MALKGIDLKVRWSGDYRGDVVYTITVELNDVPGAPLRWGMTTMVEIEVD